EQLDRCDRRSRTGSRPARDELRVLTWEGDSREPEEHTLSPERVARLLAGRRQDAEQQLREAEGRLRRHAVRFVREGAEPSEVKALFGDQVAEAVDREQQIGRASCRGRVYVTVGGWTCK